MVQIYQEKLYSKGSLQQTPLHHQRDKPHIRHFLATQNTRSLHLEKDVLIHFQSIFSVSHQ